jgi:hypothetical protein
LSTKIIDSRSIALQRQPGIPHSEESAVYLKWAGSLNQIFTESKEACDFGKKCFTAFSLNFEPMKLVRVIKM